MQSGQIPRYGATAFLISEDTLFTPLFFITSLAILYPYFKNKVNFIIICIICGFFYDIAFMDSAFINTISFGICSYFIIMCYGYFNYSIYSSNLINIFNIIVYRIISYILLVIVDYVNFDGFSLLEGIYNSILLNIIYGIFIYLIATMLSKIFKIKKD